MPGAPTYVDVSVRKALALAAVLALVAVPLSAASAAAGGWPDLSEADIRPGVGIVDHSILSNSCTAAFVYSDAANETLYISTASHCFPNGQIGDHVEIGGIAAAGEIAYCSWRHTEPYDVCSDGDATVDDPNDFALVRIHDHHRDEVHPAIKHWGGPTGTATDTDLGDPLTTSGASPLHPDQTDAREGYVIDELDDSDWTTEGYFFHPSISGDSGSPVMTADGQALGVMSYISQFGGINGFSNVHKAVPFAEDKMGVDLELKTWETLASPVLPELPDESDIPDIPDRSDVPTDAVEDDAGSGVDAPNERADDVRVDPQVRYQGNLTAAEEDWYAFEGEAGQTLQVRTYGTTQHWFTVVDPDGDMAFLGRQFGPLISSTPVNVSLTQSGTWYLHFYGGGVDHYRFSFGLDEPAPDPSPSPTAAMPEAPGLPG